MKSFRPDLEHWETVLTTLRPWEVKNEDGTDKYTMEQQKTMLSTDRIAKSVYVLGNGGATDVYTNQETAYEIREALRARYENTEQWGLTTLTEKYNEVVRGNQYACPDMWFDSLQYYKELMTRAGGAEKTDAEIVAHVLATAPNIYDSVTTLVLGKDLKEKDILKYTREQYRSYWKRHFEGQANRRNRNNVAYAFTHGNSGKNANQENTTSTSRYGGKNQGRGGGKKPWKKFKGNCKKCGVQGHKPEDCPNMGNNVDKRKCYGCNEVGHIRANCPHANKNNNNKKKDESAFLGMCFRTNENESDGEDLVKVYKEVVDVEGYIIIDEQGKETSEYVYSDAVIQKEFDRIEQINMAIGDEFEEEEDKDEFAPPINSVDLHNYDKWLTLYDLRCYDCRSIMTYTPWWSHSEPRKQWYCKWCDQSCSEEWGGYTLVQCPVCTSFGPDSVECAFCWVDKATPAMENNNKTPIEALKFYHKHRRVYPRHALAKYIWYNHLIFLMETAREEIIWDRTITVRNMNGNPAKFR